MQVDISGQQSFTENFNCGSFADVSVFSARERLRDTGDHGRSAEINAIFADYPMIIIFPVRQRRSSCLR